MTDDDKARSERARQLRAEIDALAKGERVAPAPRTPREFIDGKMRERDRETPETADRANDVAGDDAEPSQPES